MISISNEHKQKSAIAVWSLTAVKCNPEGLTLTPEVLHSVLTPISKKYVFGEEKGESGYEHYQIFISLKIKVRNPRSVLALVIPPEFSDFFYICPAGDPGALAAYCQKDGIIHKGPKSYISKIDSEIILRPWQVNVEESLFHLIQTNNHRKMIFVSDIVGAAGKTVFLRYLSAKEDLNTVLLPRCSVSSMYSVLTDVMIASEGDTRPLVLLIDLVRSDNLAQKENILELFQFIEQSLNCWVSSGSHGRFREAKRLLGSVQVVCVSNLKPAIVYQYLSKDRFDIFKID